MPWICLLKQETEQKIPQRCYIILVSIYGMVYNTQKVCTHLIFHHHPSPGTHYIKSFSITATKDIHKVRSTPTKAKKKGKWVTQSGGNIQNRIEQTCVRVLISHVMWKSCNRDDWLATIEASCLKPAKESSSSSLHGLHFHSSPRLNLYGTSPKVGNESLPPLSRLPSVPAKTLFIGSNI